MNESKYVLIGVLGVVFIISAAMLGNKALDEPGLITVGDKICTLVLKEQPNDPGYNYKTYECEDL